MSKLLKYHTVGFPETKTQQGRKFDKAYWVCVCICKENKK